MRDAELKAEHNRTDGKNEGVSFQGLSTLGALAAPQTSSLLKMRVDLEFGSPGMETVWTQCAIDNRSITQQYQPEPTWLPPPTIQSTNNMKWNLI